LIVKGRACMFDFGAKWTPAAPLEDGAIGANGLAITLRTSMSLCFVSGDVSAGLSRLGPAPRALGVTDVAETSDYALAIAHDRCLVVSQTPRVFQEGWSDAGFCITDVTDGFVAVELVGPTLDAILPQATTLDWARPSRSAAVNFAGVTAYGSRVIGGVIRLFVETSMTPYLRRWLELASTSIDA
jgi:hypothetical protein